ncbi:MULTISPECIES: glycine cleavage system protein GcvH [Thiorhodovibrio]|uniref:glycine cleavage system protein GcvH n=1 Tax=Thiorhodovibrio TaxID=61593 RepID=UPI001911F61A|nr:MULTISPECIES: glycine cleavage system protein GcvH [Thiorhodovibrio]MBK5968279.1 glycine cleavage system protein H [Thiorhodovibrio winogradskyi]WPL13017.1 Glycine cleavage system H protein [Thiorhodovibrio litoralis]
MSQVPSDRVYNDSHEWLMDNGDGTATVGISDHAQDALGDLVFVEPPKIGDALSAKEACAVVESVKAASDIYSPISGEVVEVNEELGDSPELINGDAYGAGWIFRLTISEPSEIEELLTAEAYGELIAEEE